MLMALASLRFQRNAQDYEESRQGMTVFARSKAVCTTTTPTGNSSSPNRWRRRDTTSAHAEAEPSRN